MLAIGIVIGVCAMALFVIAAYWHAEMESRRGMSPEERQAAADSFRAARRGDSEAVREAETRLARARRARA